MMIKLEKTHKYFNRHKKNELHVINNTSLKFILLFILIISPFNDNIVSVIFSRMFNALTYLRKCRKMNNRVYIIRLK